MKNTTTLSIQCHTEYDNLEHVLVAPPTNMAITEIINETQRNYANENIDIDIAVEQHENFVNVLRKENINVHELDTKKELNEQVFTRDIGFTIGDKLFISHMDRDIRKKEIPVLTDWLDNHKLNFTLSETHSIEGGDVIVHHKDIWIGVSGRTTNAAIDELEAELPGYNIHRLKLREDILHLDCAFNIIDDHTGLVYADAFNDTDLQTLRKKYTLIDVSSDEQFAMGPNVLAIGERKIISLPENKRINQLLVEADFNVIEVPFSEIIKSGGSYRCCTLPLLRK
ncbi:dimethylarginine dimethylaminohydrolase family protein [Oceanobacillus sp. CAU 1775]